MTTQSSKDQFDRNAEKYATSHVHRSGPSLPVLLELARPEEADEALDVATGTGHTAIAVSHHVRKAIGLEFNLKGRVTAFQEPMLVVRACSKGDELKQTAWNSSLGKGSERFDLRDSRANDSRGPCLPDDSVRRQRRRAGKTRQA